PAPPRRDCGTSRSPRARAGRSPLPRSPRPRRGTWHAPARSPPPPRSRHPVRPGGTRAAGPCRPVRRHRAVPRYGHDLLAAPGRGGAGAGGSSLSPTCRLRRTALVHAACDRALPMSKKAHTTESREERLRYFGVMGGSSLGPKMQGVYQNIIASLRDFYGTFTTSLALSVILSSVKASDAVSSTPVTGVCLMARCWVDQREGDPMDLYTFLKRLPKVSLHVHLAGSVQPSTLVELASQNAVALPAYREPKDLYDYPDIYQFLQMLDRVMASVRDRADFHRITYETLHQAAEHGVRHREMFWNPTTHMACGVPYETAVDGIIEGIRDARTDFGIHCFLIAAINRMGTPELGLEMVQTVQIG